jgi:hypothetical protein
VLRYDVYFKAKLHVFITCIIILLNGSLNTISVSGNSVFRMLFFFILKLLFFQVLTYQIHFSKRKKKKKNSKYGGKECGLYY